ncbi:MAG TPA: YhcH/YjgK/YiaL family protein [Bacteroidales bacterium]
MVVDTLTNAKAYYGLHPLFQKAFEYIESHDLLNAPVGRTDLDGNDLYLMVQEPDAKEEENAKLEAHCRYIDIQMPLKSEESFGWKALTACVEEKDPYNVDKDIVFFSDEPSTYITLYPAQFAIFFAEDSHAPCIGTGKLKKIVVKVRI